MLLIKSVSNYCLSSSFPPCFSSPPFPSPPYSSPPPFLPLYQLTFSHSVFLHQRMTSASENHCSEVSVTMRPSVQFSYSVVSNSLQPHGLQHARPPVHHQLPGFTQTHVHWVGDAIQPSHPLLSPSPPAFNLSQHQGLFKCQFFASGGQSIGVPAAVRP